MICNILGDFMTSKKEVNLRTISTYFVEAQLIFAALCFLPFFQEMGGVKVLIFFVTSSFFISASFRVTLTIKIFKIISVIRKIDWRALYGRARKPRVRPANLEKVDKIAKSWVTYCEA